MSSGALEAIGNGLNNTLTGNEGDNILNGDAGKDTMTGGAGNDYYFVDNLADVVNETIANGKGGGIDTVESSVAYSLGRSGQCRQSDFDGRRIHQWHGQCARQCDLRQRWLQQAGWW